MIKSPTKVSHYTSSDEDDDNFVTADAAATSHTHVVKQINSKFNGFMNAVLKISEEERLSIPSESLRGWPLDY